MKAILLAGALVCALAPVAHPALAGSPDPGPVRLNDAQMDAISAGTAGVTVQAVALAAGFEGALATTDTRTFARGTRRVDIAFGIGFAYASGDIYQFASVSTQLSGEGDLVIGRTFGVALEDERAARALGGGVVIAITHDGARFRPLRAR